MNPIRPNEPKPDGLDLLLRVGGFVVIAFVVLIVASGLMARLDPVVRSAFAVLLAGLVANLFLSFRFDRGRFSDFGLGWDSASLPNLGRGFGLGLGAVSISVGAAVLTGLAKFEEAPPEWSPAWLAIVLLAGVLGEELVFRGYAFQYLLRSYNRPLVVIGAAVLFGSAHLSNDHVKLLGAANTILWGCLLGYAYTRTGTLWLSSGLHFGWNLTLALLTSNMSGITIRATAWDLRWSAGDLWSGGGYGLEGGLLAAILALPVFLLLRRVR